MRVVLAEDSVLLREGLIRLLGEAGTEVVAAVADGPGLVRAVVEHRPDVAVVDVRMPPTHTDEGLRAARTIRSEHPGTAVLVLSAYVDEASAMELLSESTERTGYLLKDRVSDLDALADSLRRIAAGGSVLDPSVVGQLGGRPRRGRDPLEELSAREREVLELMAQGKTNKAIAEELVITPHTVEKHVTSVMGKLRIPASADDHRRVLAVLTFLDSA